MVVIKISDFIIKIPLKIRASLQVAYTIPPSCDLLFNALCDYLSSSEHVKKCAKGQWAPGSMDLVSNWG